MNLLVSLFFVFLFSCKAGNVDVLSQEAYVESQDLEKSLLWKISGNQLANSSYLFGTIHMIDSEDFFWPKGTLSALDASTEIVFEIDMEEMTDISNLMLVFQKAFMNDGLTLKDLLSKEDYKTVEAHFKKMGFPLIFFERIKPMFLAVFASGDFDPEDMQVGAIKSYEMEFTEIAQNSNIEIGGLETVEYQISLFDDIPYEDQAQMLMDAIHSSNLEDDQLKELIKVYKSQDIEAMYELMKGDESINKFEDLLLTTRNKNWIPIMEGKMINHSTFFAVGAGHLGGPNGVIRLLRQEGYKVQPVQN